MMKLREENRREEMSLVWTGAVATSYRTRFEKRSQYRIGEIANAALASQVRT